MSQVSLVRVTNRQQWSKECQLRGQIVYIGSRDDNDIALKEAAGLVEERHLLLRPSALNPYGYALFNLSATNIHHYGIHHYGIHHYGVGKSVRESAGEIINPGASVELDHGHKIIFADHELVYVVGAQTSPMFELGISMESTILSPKETLRGHISIKNSGNQDAAQFEVLVEGLPAKCIEIEAGPLLFSGVQKEVAFTLKHPEQARPPAGLDHPIRFHVTAHEAYPGERATLVQMIEIAPYRAHSVSVIDFVPGTGIG